MVLGVRLNIEVGKFHAVSALAARWNTQLTYTYTSLHPHKHLFAARRSLFRTLRSVSVLSASRFLVPDIPLLLPAPFFVGLAPLHGVTPLFLPDRNPLWTCSNLTSRLFFFQNNRPPIFVRSVLPSSSASSPLFVISWSWLWMNLCIISILVNAGHCVYVCALRIMSPDEIMWYINTSINILIRKHTDTSVTRPPMRPLKLQA